MEVYINEIGELTCEAPTPQSTVSDLIDATLRFCRTHIDCSLCSHTCCSGLIVYADNIFIKNLSNTKLVTIDKQDSFELILRVLKLDHTAKWTLAQNSDGKCIFLSREYRCLIYEARPLVCRMHTCIKCQQSYIEMKNSLYYAYQQALKMEMQNLLSSVKSPPDPYPNCTNPAFGMKNYDTLISDILKWSEENQLSTKQRS